MCVAQLLASSACNTLSKQLFYKFGGVYHSWLPLSPRACNGLPPVNHMLLEHKVPSLMAERQSSNEERVSHTADILKHKGTNGHSSINGSKNDNGTSVLTNGYHIGAH